MKKAVILIIFYSVVICNANSAEIDFHLGLGWYFSSYEDDQEISKLNNFKMPIGLGGYLGFGAGTGLFSMGAEFVPVFNMGVSDNYSPIATLAFQPRLYTKFKIPGDMFTAVLFGGYANTAVSNEKYVIGSPVFGFRFAVLFIYLEYSIHMERELNFITKHEISLGGAIVR